MIKRDDWTARVLVNGVVDIQTNGGYTFQQVMNNRNCSKDPKYWYKIAREDKFLFKSSVAESWEFSLPNEANPIRNQNQIYLRFLDTFGFREVADQFTRYSSYTSALPNMPEYNRFWDTQKSFCLYGRTIDGVRMSGRQYFMLNFTRMKARYVLPNGKWSKNKQETFPSFADHQYYLLNELENWYQDGLYTNERVRKVWFPNWGENEIEALRKYSGAVPKARRKGITYVAGNAVNLYNFWWYRDSYNLIGAYQEEFYSVMRDEAIIQSLNWINSYTPWVRRREVSRAKDSFRTSFMKEGPNGTPFETGYMSSMSFVTFGGTAFKGVGKGAFSITIEEAGKFNNLISVYSISIDPLLRDGNVYLGSAFILGTAGEMDGSGGSRALYEMSYAPESFGLHKYANIYDVGGQGYTSYFIDNLWMYPVEGYTRGQVRSMLIDKDELAFFDSMPELSAFDSTGNSYRFIARAIQLYEREVKKKSSTKVYMSYITQNPLHLEEAFLVNDVSPFDVATVKEQKAFLRAKSTVDYVWGEFIQDRAGHVSFRNDMSKRPVDKFPRDLDKEEGCWMIYAHPGMDKANRRYIAGTDPIDKGYDETVGDSMHSLASTYIMDVYTGNLVAAYHGRPARSEMYFEQLLYGLEYYNCTTMYENNLKSLFDYAAGKKKLSLLANEPMILKGKAGYTMGKQNTKGVHMTNQNLIAELRGWVADWLDEEVVVDQVDGTNIMSKRYYTIWDTGLLDELELWNSNGNFDRVSALQMLILYYHDITARSGRNIGVQVAEEEPSYVRRLKSRLSIL